MKTTQNTTGTKEKKKQVKAWLLDLRAMGLKTGWMLRIRDLLTENEYPEMVLPDKDIKETVRDYFRVGAEEVVEVYNLGMDLEAQLSEEKAWNI